MDNTTSFTSPLVNAVYGAGAMAPQLGPLLDALARVSVWTVLFTLLAVAVAYDQSMFRARRTALTAPGAR